MNKECMQDEQSLIFSSISFNYILNIINLYRTMDIWIFVSYFDLNRKHSSKKVYVSKK